MLGMGVQVVELGSEKAHDQFGIFDFEPETGPRSQTSEELCTTSRAMLKLELSACLARAGCRDLLSNGALGVGLRGGVREGGEGWRWASGGRKSREIQKAGGEGGNGRSGAEPGCLRRESGHNRGQCLKWGPKKVCGPRGKVRHGYGRRERVPESLP